MVFEAEEEETAGIDDEPDNRSIGGADAEGGGCCNPDPDADAGPNKLFIA